MRVVQHLDHDLWREFVDNHPHGNVFHTPEMFRVFAETKGHRPEVWAVVDGTSEVLALMTPVHVSLKQGMLRPLVTRSIAYGGALNDNSVRGKEALHLLLNSYAKNNKYRCLFIELRNHHDFSYFRPVFGHCGYSYDDHLNYLIHLDRPAEAIFQSIGTSTRKKIRKALRDGHVKISEVRDRAELTRFYEILQRTYANAKVPLADRSLFEAAFDILRPMGMVKLFLAQVDGVAVACSAEIFYKDTIYGWYGGSDRSYSKYLPNEMVTWHVLREGANNGYRVYDFGGAGKPNEEYGVRDFKAKFGGQLVNYGRYTYVHSPALLHMTKTGYEVYRRYMYPLRATQPSENLSS